jgi:hypothetical protein
MSLPAPPVNVQLILFDGTTLAVDTIYRGVVNGDHQWVILNPPPVGTVRTIKIDELPPQTSVSLIANETF